ncbi:twin-arginine translocation signal domain-containing protein [Enorma massiliensis]|uniref:twin-arginine translocation signal domain-containing protein n=1 Tax=Enorma massiliensis TaxID=1472761 RepID=UPI003AF0F96D
MHVSHLSRRSFIKAAALAAGGLVLSGILPALRPLDGLARAAHLSSSYLALLIFPLHAGFHAAKTLSRLTSNVAKPAEKLGFAAWLLASCVGIYEFFSLHIWDYVTLRMPFVLSADAPLPVYLLEHACVMALFAFLGALLMRVVVRSARPIIR